MPLLSEVTSIVKDDIFSSNVVRIALNALQANHIRDHPVAVCGACEILENLRPKDKKAATLVIESSLEALRSHMQTEGIVVDFCRMLLRHDVKDSAFFAKFATLGGITLVVRILRFLPDDLGAQCSALVMLDVLYPFVKGSPPKLIKVILASLKAHKNVSGVVYVALNALVRFRGAVAKIGTDMSDELIKLTVGAIEDNMTTHPEVVARGFHVLQISDPAWFGKVYAAGGYGLVLQTLRAHKKDSNVQLFALSIADEFCGFAHRDGKFAPSDLIELTVEVLKDHIEASPQVTIVTCHVLQIYGNGCNCFDRIYRAGAYGLILRSMQLYQDHAEMQSLALNVVLGLGDFVVRVGQIERSNVIDISMNTLRKYVDKSSEPNVVKAACAVLRLYGSRGFLYDHVIRSGGIRLVNKALSCYKRHMGVMNEATKLRDALLEFSKEEEDNDNKAVPQTTPVANISVPERVTDPSAQEMRIDDNELRQKS
eukprot:CAMPEP_0116574810 /NCGR_PEP_ID=MMETSP0397-20121206/19605_1 /TAXON_ID=216820 /ORGANISM="Cyclophora tenuis, Strain ECT3854" /LENGTH=482 /DNA_ID=CAMNT_0004103625 /DNA_START=140 /DNA_END=1589 /DNA_ORIENTATION=-